MLDSIKFGAKYTDHERDCVFNATTYGGLPRADQRRARPRRSPGRPTPGDFLDEISAGRHAGAATGRSTRAVDRDILFDQLCDAARAPIRSRASRSPRRRTAATSWATSSGDGWRGNVGVRFVQHRADLERQPDRRRRLHREPVRLLHAGQRRPRLHDWLPSLNFAYDLSDHLVLRSAAARSMARPDYTDIAPRVSLNPGALTGTGGNPDSIPTARTRPTCRSSGIRPGRGGRAGASIYKDIKSFITDSRARSSSTSVGDLAEPAVHAGGRRTSSTARSHQPRSTAAAARSRASSSRSRSRSGAASASRRNYTYSDAEADNGDPMPGNSKDTYNMPATSRTSAQRPARVHLSLGLLRDVRPLHAAQPGGAVLGRRFVGGSTCTKRGVDVRRAST